MDLKSKNNECRQLVRARLDIDHGSITEMASASSSSAKNLFSDSKRRLAERVAVNVNNASSVARQIVRGSKSNEILMQAAKNFAYHESTVDNSIQNLKKMEIIFQHLNYQYEAIEQAAEKLEYVEEQVKAMER
uniref:BLOC-1-related complex subunit 7 n=1 Tax=Anopheles epiroticus TaxID=199890 RepID=A0A182P6X0_9DIPT